MKNWLIFENQRDAYIMDGVPEKMAIAMAKKDCKNNPYDAYIKERYNKTMRDLEIMEGKKSSMQMNINLPSIADALDDFTDTVIGRLLILFLFIVIIYGGAIALYGLISFVIWNFIVAPIFNLVTITFVQALVVGFVLFILKTLLSPKKS